MALKEYQHKRDFEKSPEPAGGARPPQSGALRFVVQKHQATRLHYDFRLEVDGVLKSWAVPKGPSLNPQEKKLAVMVEDHPWDYRNFEGVIGEGNYGAGTVMIWDEGTYHVPGVHDREGIQAKMRQGLARGQLEFFLEGAKLKGVFLLVRLKNEEKGNSWLLMKKEDQYASRDGDVLAEDWSARSKSSLEEIRASGVMWEPKDAPPLAEVDPDPALKEQTPAPPASRIDLSSFDLSGAKPATLPEGLEPMLATLAEEPFDRQDWLFELKWDGFRAIAEVRRDRADLCSRHNKTYEQEFRPVVRDLEKLGFEAVLDGEVVVVDERGRADFRLLQNYRKTGKGLLVYYVYDLLYIEGQDLRGVPLRTRKAVLRAVLPELPRIRYSDHIEADGIAFYRVARENDLEGIIAKDANSLYRSGVRSQDWLKFKTHQRQEAVIAGWTDPRGSRSELGALLLGVYEGGQLVYVGHAGGGFTGVELVEMKQRLKPLVRKTSPFEKRIKTNTPATWVEPRLICEVKFAGWTEEGLMRQPVYLGLREDKAPEQVRREKPIPASQALNRKKYIAPEAKNREITRIGGQEVTLTNPRKVFWPEEGITKGEMVSYYRAIAPVLLPHLKDRPLSLHRFPNGIQGKSFFQKDVDEAPDWIRRVNMPSERAKEGSIDYVVVEDEAALAWVANLGAIELNPWNARAANPDHPDYLAVDLDPVERPFDDVIRTALVIHEILETIAVPLYPKTSGATGLHIFIPLGAKYTYEQTRQFALLINQLVHSILPELTSLERSPAKRVGKIYLDYLQNRAGQTMVAPYSLRPRPGAPVSTPLRWDELKPGLTPRDFNIYNLLARVEKVGDLWAGVQGPGIDMQAALMRLQSAWGDLQERLGQKPG